MDLYKRMSIPRGLVAATSLGVALAWILFAVDRQQGLGPPVVQTVTYLALFAITVHSRQAKVAIVRFLQRWTLNPLMKALLALGVNPLGLTVLETRGRVSGQLRRTPVGDGRQGDSVWIIAEHGTRANYVRNILADPRVRVRLRRGLRYVWVPGLATVLPDDDALARQRQVIRWHPLRAFNAMNVRILGTDLLTVHVRLLPAEADEPTDPREGPPAPTWRDRPALTQPRMPPAPSELLVDARAPAGRAHLTTTPEVGPGSELGWPGARRTSGRTTRRSAGLDGADDAVPTQDAATGLIAARPGAPGGPGRG